MISSRPLLLASLVAVCLALAGCQGGQGATQAGRAGPRAIAVRVAPVETRDVVYRIQALGSLEAEEMVQVTAEVEGAASEVRFHEGDRVTSDSVLLRIDPEHYRLETARAAASYRKALADAQRAEQEATRREQLAREQLVSAEDLQRARQDAERLGAEVAAVKAAWDIARESLRKSEVRPPRPGVINTRSVDTGQYVKDGAVLATLVDTTRLRLRFKVSESESLRVREGANVDFRVKALGERGFQARVYHVGEVADPATRQVEVLGWVKNPGVLKPGFFAGVSLVADSRKGALVVPEGAVQASEQGFVAYVVEDARARLRPIQIGMRTSDGIVEILAGLKAGESVVVEGSDRLAEGAAVQAVGARREAAPGGEAQAGAAR